MNQNNRQIEKKNVPHPQQRAADYIQSFPAFGTTEFLSLSVCLFVWVVMFYIYIRIIWHFQGKGEIFSLVLHVKQNKVWIGSTWRSALDFYSKMFMLDGFLFHSPAYCSAYIYYICFLLLLFSFLLIVENCVQVLHFRETQKNRRRRWLVGCCSYTTYLLVDIISWWWWCFFFYYEKKSERLARLAVISTVTPLIRGSNE